MRTMNISALANHPLRLSLQSHQVIATDEAKGLAVKALRGSVWVTLEDGGADHILKQGDSLPIRDGRRVVIEALVDSEIGFSPAHAKAWTGGITPTRYAEDCWACL